MIGLNETVKQNNQIVNNSDNVKVPTNAETVDAMTDSGIGNSPNANKHNTDNEPALMKNECSEQNGGETPGVDTSYGSLTDNKQCEVNKHPEVTTVTTDDLSSQSSTDILKVEDVPHGASSEDEWFDAGPIPISQAMLPSINGMTESAMTVTNEFPADGSGSQPDFSEEEFRPATEGTVYFMYLYSVLNFNLLLGFEKQQTRVAATSVQSHRTCQLFCDSPAVLLHLNAHNITSTLYHTYINKYIYYSKKTRDQRSVYYANNKNKTSSICYIISQTKT